MHEMKITKNASDVSPVSGIPDEEALALISQFARKTPDAESIYTFSVILCDNEIDRDNERFSVESLETLRKMFVGVTGIFDHSMKSSDQTARVYKTELVRDGSKTTLAGEAYTCLKAWCYMLRTDKNEELIREIDCGIKKEVSISCSVDSKICSICGNDIRSRDCCHTVGEKINGKACHLILANPTDAYEWSFVAVPAQRNAGVSKSVKTNGTEVVMCTSEIPEEIMKSALETNGNVTLTTAQIKAFNKYIEKLKNYADLGENCRKEAEKEIIALSAFTLPDADTEMMCEILKKLTGEEVVMLRKALGDRAEGMSVYKATFTSEKRKSFNDNSQFRI